MKGKLALRFWVGIALLSGTRVAEPGLIVVTGPALDPNAPADAVRWWLLSPPVAASGLAARWLDPWRSRRSATDAFFIGRFGMPSWTYRLHYSAPGLALTSPPLQEREGEPPWLTLAAAPVPPRLDPEDEAIVPPAPAVFATKKPCLARPVTFLRAGDENETFSLTTCDGQIAPLALDRLSVVTRALDAPRPVIPLPDEPAADARPTGEWTPGVRLLEPALLWLIQHLADAFPRQWLSVVSGYRTGLHPGKHGAGRALDFFFWHVPKEALYRACRALADTGCGYYPNNSFVHVDVRRPGTGRAFWIDVAAPGEPSEYVASWPGVEDEEAKLGPSGEP